MRTVELILAAILSFIIVVDFTYPPKIHALIKSPVGIVAVLGTVLFLFTKSTVLGVLGIIAGFVIVQRGGTFTPKYSAYDTAAVSYNNDPMMSRATSLEETVVSNMVPTTYALNGLFSFKNSFSDVKNAACVF